MNKYLKTVTEKIKNPKVITVIGICGILLIFLSSFLPSFNTKSEITAKSDIDLEKYKSDIEESIKQIVTSISGDEKPTVTVTLESGIRYTYADQTKNDSSNSSGDKNSQASESTTKTYITVRSSDGGEQPLIVSELMPSVRGVAVICEGGDDETVSEKIENAVTAALNITSKRVYIAGGKQYEKG